MFEQEVRELIIYLLKHSELKWDISEANDFYLCRKDIKLDKLTIACVTRFEEYEDKYTYHLHIHDNTGGYSECYNSSKIPEIKELCLQGIDIKKIQHAQQNMYLTSILNVING